MPEINNTTSEALAINAIPPEKILYRLHEAFGADSAKILGGAKFRVGEESARVVAFPREIGELSEMLRLAGDEKWRIIPAGAGTWLEVGNRPAYFHLVISTALMNRIVEYEPADLTATVEAGVTLGDFNRVAGAHRQFIPLDPFGAAESTIGAVVSAASSGPLSCGYGTPRDWLIGISVVHPGGAVSRAGGKVVKNVAGYDLCKLYTGSFGTLGIIAGMSFKLRAIPPADRTVLLYGERPGPVAKLVAAIADSELQPSAMEIASPGDEAITAEPGKFALAVRFLNEPDAVESQINELLRAGTGLQSSVLSAGDAQAFWERYNSTELGRDTEFSLRLTGLTSDLLSSVEDLASTLPETKWRAHAASGTVRIHAGHGWLDSLGTRERVRKLIELRRRAQARGGHLVVQRAPDELLDKVDVWGDVGPAVELMRALKGKFDPETLLNPGRFVAGI